jgi:hypothetical protein
MTGAPPPPAFSIEMGVSQTFLPGWPQTMILQISASQVARITGIEFTSLHFPKCKAIREAYIIHTQHSISKTLTLENTH